MAVARYLCTNCQARQENEGMCSQCPDEPLLDLVDEQTWFYFDEQDTREKFRRYRQGAMIGMPFGIILLFFIWPYSGYLVGALAAAGVTMGAAALFSRLVPPKKTRPQLTAQEIQALQQVAGDG
jgi:hypothetical protein